MNVLIVQMQNKQLQQIKTKYKGPHTLELRDSSEPERWAELDGQVSRADKVILVTKFCSHKVLSHIPVEKRLYANGGISSVMAILGEL